MTIYDEFREVAAEVIAEFPKDVSFTARLDPGDYDPATGATTGTPDTYEVTASAPVRYDRKYVDGEIIREDDVRIYAAAPLAFSPTLGWTVTIDAETWEVVGLRDIPHGSDRAAWEFQLRRG